VFDDGERYVLLMLLWNHAQAVEAANSGGDVPAERAEAARVELERIAGIVRKLGGDPTKTAFGAVAV
jgi:hypothetical protein